MPELILADRRADLIESRHRITVAVVDGTGGLVARAGDPSATVFWRSTAKPFQLWPLVVRGGIERFGLESEHLALACASHNAEPEHRRVAAEWLSRIEATEAELSCGGHPSLSAAVAEAMIRDGVDATPIWSNCSGKHAAMLALARLEGWPAAGYQRVEHPVQRVIAAAIAQWTGLPVDALRWGVDGCTAAAVATPLDRLALAWSRLGTSDDPAMGTIRAAMLRHPGLIAGSGRLDTLLMESWPGELLVKVGAGGVYAASLPRFGLGVGLKVEDGDMRAAGIALVAVLERVVARLAPGVAWSMASLGRWREPEIRNTRGEVTGQSTIEGELHFT